MLQVIFRIMSFTMNIKHHSIWNNRPKKDNITALDEYRKAETIGEEQGDCWSFYPQCPFSIFNIIPDIYTKDDQVKKKEMTRRENTYNAFISLKLFY